MKCPVCDQENSTMLCSRCGFDASRDYERYPTLAPLGRVPSVAALRRAQQMLAPEKQEQLLSLINVLLTIQYRKIAATSPDLRGANRRIRQLEQELAAERDSNAKLQTELMNLETMLRQENLERSRQIQRLEQKLSDKIQASQKSGKKLRTLNNRLQTLERKHDATLAENAELQRQNEKLKADLEAERNKGVFDRLFNR